MRTALAWACGIVAALTSGFLYSWLTGAAGVPMFEGDQRLVGATYHAELLLAVVVGCWAGLAAFNGQWGGPLTAIGRVSLVAWLAAAVVLAALAVPFDIAFLRRAEVWAQVAHVGFVLAAVTGVGITCYCWWKRHEAPS